MELFVYKSAKIISNVLKSLYQNEYFILDNQQFSDMLSSLPPLLDDEEDVVPYEVESSFTNIANRDTMEYIIEQIYTDKNLKSTCSKLVLKRLLIKLATECIYTFSDKFYKLTDGCTMYCTKKHTSQIMES